MARYLKSNCETFVDGVQENVRSAKGNIEQKFAELNFHGADETTAFETYYNLLISALEQYSKTAGKYGFLSS